MLGGGLLSNILGYNYLPQPDPMLLAQGLPGAGMPQQGLLSHMGPPMSQNPDMMFRPQEQGLQVGRAMPFDPSQVQPSIDPALLGAVTPPAQAPMQAIPPPGPNVPAQIPLPQAGPAIQASGGISPLPEPAPSELLQPPGEVAPTERNAYFGLLHGFTDETDRMVKALRKEQLWKSLAEGGAAMLANPLSLSRGMAGVGAAFGRNMSASSLDDLRRVRAGEHTELLRARDQAGYTQALTERTSRPERHSPTSRELGMQGVRDLIGFGVTQGVLEPDDPRLPAIMATARVSPELAIKRLLEIEDMNKLVPEEARDPSQAMIKGVDPETGKIIVWSPADSYRVLDMNPMTTTDPESKRVREETAIVNRIVALEKKRRELDPKSGSLPQSIFGEAGKNLPEDQESLRRIEEMLEENIRDLERRRGVGEPEEEEETPGGSSYWETRIRSVGE